MQVENGEDGNEIDEEIASNVDQVDQEVVLAHPYLNVEGLQVDHDIDGDRSANRNNVAQSERDQRAFQESPLIFELGWLENARQSHVQICVDYEKANGLHSE